MVDIRGRLIFCEGIRDWGVPWALEWGGVFLYAIEKMFYML